MDPRGDLVTSTFGRRHPAPRHLDCEHADIVQPVAIRAHVRALPQRSGSRPATRDFQDVVTVFISVTSKHSTWPSAEARGNHEISRSN